jgi:hypothetical protein
MPYAIMVPWDNDGYMYVTRPIGEMFEVEPILYESYDAAKESASIWGSVARIVEYKEDRNATTSGT